MELLRPLLGDQPARERIAGKDPADLERSFAVEAGAGSGKTSELVRRLVGIAEMGATRDESDPLSDVVAISFTRKAAAELRAQTYRGLAERSAQLAEATEPDGIRRHARLRGALARLDTVCIDTIHGFCGRILRAEALAIGLQPDYDVLGEKEAVEDRLAFWRRYVARTRDDQLAEVGYEARDVLPLFERLSERPGRLPVPYGSPMPDPAPAVAYAIERVRELQSLRDGRARGVRDPLQRAMDRAERLAEYQGVDSPLGGALFLQEVLSGCEANGKKERVWPRRWPDQMRARELLETDLPELAEAIRPSVRAWQAYAYDRALAYALEAVEAFAADRVRVGRITQDDVLSLTARLLRAHPRARRRAADRYRRLLVDEFQDTDPIQAEILFILAADDAGDATPLTDWRTCRPRPGSLFLVGDPKQAIYRFRGADIRTYAEARDVLQRSGGETLHMTTCFRSVPALCDWINASLAPPFEQDVALQGGEGRQAHYEPLRSGRDTAGAGAYPHVARIDVPAVAGHAAPEIASVDADVIARVIRAAVDGRAAPALYGEGARPFDDRARYGDFMVLCRAATRFRQYAAALEAQGVPYALAGDKHLGRSDELRALVDLLDALRDPLDGPVVLGLRTGLLGGFDAPALLGIHRDGIDGATKERVEEWKTMMGEARRALDELPLGAALERIAQSTGLLSVAAARREGGSARAGSLLKLLARVREYEPLGLHWTEAADRLRELMTGETSDGAITLEEGAADAVRIMTVHQAKGLQAPVVILADPYAAFEH
jgi:ATP-dependent helicase/nuclease subunit A